MRRATEVEVPEIKLQWTVPPESLLYISHKNNNNRTFSTVGAEIASSEELVAIDTTTIQSQKFPLIRRFVDEEIKKGDDVVTILKKEDKQILFYILVSYYIYRPQVRQDRTKTTI